MVTRQKDVSGTGFQVRLQAEEAAGVPGPEYISWFAMSEGTDGHSNVGKTGNAVNHDPHTISFGTDQSNPPFFFAAMQTFNGPDTATLRMRSLASASVQVHVEEEQS